MSSDLANNDFKELVRSRTDLVALVGESVALTPSRGGAEFKCLCPFHDDHTPSLTVYPDRQSFRCWACSTGGDCFTWVMEFDKVEFREALETLAKRAGLEMPTFAGRRPETAVAKTDVLDVLAWAENEFHQYLLDSQMAAPAREYLKERGFTAETIAKFKLGFGPNDSQWLLARGRGKFSLESMESARIIKKSDEGTGYYTFFGLKNRVLFPIRNDKGRCVSFGGRVLPQFAEPGVGKYINGLESDVYSKSNLLFAFDAAREGIRKTGTAVIVEGYTDALISHQFDVTNVVGVCGTALTQAHVDRLKRFAQRIVLMFDGDEAGQKAAEKALANYLSENVDLRVLVLPDGQDPDEFLFAHGADEYRRQIDSAAEAWDFKLQTEINRHGLESIDARHRVLTSMLELLAKVSKLRGSVKEDVILNRLASRTLLSEQVVRQRLSEARSASSSGVQPNAALPNRNVAAAGTPQRGAETTARTMGAPGTALAHKSPRADGASGNRSLCFLDRSLTKGDRMECELLEIIFTDPATLDEIRREIGDEDFYNEQTRAVLQVCFDLLDNDETPTFDRISAVIEDAALKRLIVWIDEQARKKEIADKLKDNLIIHGGAAAPSYLAQTLEPIRFRRAEQQHQRNTGRLAQQPDARAGLNPNAKALLEQATAFHQKRAAKAT
ncbi:MAG: DNA primase [Planctomycetaceae bacterium]